jgi:hypothetical protein
MKDYKRVLTVYPHSKVYSILGYHIPALNASLARWAHIMSNAVRFNEETFSQCEWSALAEAHEGTLFESSLENPNEILARKLEDASCAYLEEKWNINIGRVTSLLRTMAPLESWAVVTVIQFYWRELDNIELTVTRFWELDEMMRLNALRMNSRGDYYKRTKPKKKNGKQPAQSSESST